MDSRDLLERLLPDHDGGEVGGVAGQHQQAEDGPEVHEETPSPAFRRLRIKKISDRHSEITNLFILGGDVRRLSTFCPSAKIAINPGGNQANQNRRAAWALMKKRESERLYLKKSGASPSFAEI